MESYTSEHAESDLRELTSELSFVDATKNSDSVAQLIRRKNRYWFAVDLARDLIHGLQPERRLRLKIGETAVKTAQGYLKPDVELDLRKENKVWPGDSFALDLQEELYVGWRDRVPLSEVARTLGEGGELSIVEVPIEAIKPA
jgi:hypothetical protein